MARPQQPLKEKLQERLVELKALRDEIRLDLHLAGMEVRDEWKELESRMPDRNRAAGQLKGATTKTLDKLAGELRQFQARIRKDDRERGTVGRLMTRTVTSCAAADSLAAALTAMWNADIGFLPVIGEDGALVGVITDRDAAVAACTRGKRMDEIPVEAVMNREVTSCAETDDLSHALDLMRVHRVRRLPVLDGQGKLSGVITLGDAVLAARAADARPRHAELVATLSAIVGPSAAN